MTSTENYDIVNFLSNAFLQNHTSHAYIVVAERQQLPELLKQCAKVCMCKSHTATDNCEHCKKVQLNLHQDVLRFPQDEQKGRLTVADMITLVDESYKRPIDSGDVRVFLVDASNSVTGVGAEIWQNKLLKTLEEPNENIYIFIGVSDSESLLPTIRSRCQIIKQTRLSESDIWQRLQKRGYAQQYCEIAASVCGGNVQTAEGILANASIMRSFQNAMAFLTEMTSTKNALQFVTPVLTERDTAVWFLNFLTVLLRESIVYRLSENLAILPSYKEQILKICENYSLQAAECCIEKINSAKQRCDDGGNLTVVLDQLASSMLEVKYRCRI